MYRSKDEPIRQCLSTTERWLGADNGLIASWERGKELSVEDPGLRARALAGELVVLGWKGGIEKRTKKGWQYGTLRYLAMWQGLRIRDREARGLTCINPERHRYPHRSARGSLEGRDHRVQGAGQKVIRPDRPIGQPATAQAERTGNELGCVRDGRDCDGDVSRVCSMGRFVGVTLRAFPFLPTPSFFFPRSRPRRRGSVTRWRS